MDQQCRVQVAVDAPQHTGLRAPLDYASEQALAPGLLVRVPLGRRDLTGVVWPAGLAAPGQANDKPVALRAVREVLTAVPPLSLPWCELVTFCASYYQRSVGEVALAALPFELRTLGNGQLQTRIAKLHKTLPTEPTCAHGLGQPRPSPEQAHALASLSELTLNNACPVALLHGATGSGKTEVYLREAERVLAQGRQVLVLVPEINLTPQLEQRFAERFSAGPTQRHIVSLHSGLTPAQRLKNWLSAHLGLSDLVLGTRLAIFASLPRLGLIVVDEEHDPSYKQQEGARYSARDLAVYRGRLERATVLLGSATPSLESWQRSEEGRYARLSMHTRMGGGVPPQVLLVDMNRSAHLNGESRFLSPQLVSALQSRLERGEQSLVFLNRRGYAPVLHCEACGWKSACSYCSAWRVFHKLDRTLRCHHCGYTQPVPRACPDCGNTDIAPIGRGTERLEEQLAHLLQGPDGRPARLARIDADSTRRKGSLQAQMGAVHAGEVDVLVGTQMIAKGHDFRRVTLVAAVNPDCALFSSDFRAPERLFALLLQAAGRAGRDAAQAERSQMLVQTWHPRHALYQALSKHDFASFAASQLAERQIAGLPPYSHLALLRAEARSADTALAFLRVASEVAAGLIGADRVALYAPVPTGVARVANVERMQMLIESTSRTALQQLLSSLLPQLDALRRQRSRSGERIMRWAVDVDPAVI